MLYRGFLKVSKKIIDATNVIIKTKNKLKKLLIEKDEYLILLTDALDTIERSSFIRSNNSYYRCFAIVF